MRVVVGVAICAFVATASLSARAAADEETAGLITEMVTAALAREQRFEVVSSGDVRRQLEVEANKSLLGCETSASCLAEIAGAMGAQLVVYGKFGRIDDLTVLTLNLYDSSRSRAAGRVVLQGQAATHVVSRLDAGVVELTQAYLSSMSADAKVKVLVLDVEVSRAAAAPAAAAPSPPAESGGSALMWGGIGGLVGGVAVGAAGAVLFAIAADVDAKTDGDRSINAVEAERAYADRDTLGNAGLVAASLGVVGAGAGAILLGLSMAE